MVAVRVAVTSGWPYDGRFTSPVDETSSESDAHVICDPHSPVVGSVMLPRTLSVECRSRSRASRATEWSASYSAGTVISMSRVATATEPFLSVAVSTAFASGWPGAGRVITPRIGTLRALVAVGGTTTWT